MRRILYVPGLGDEGATEKLVTRWKKPKLEIITFSTKWGTEETYQSKYKRLKTVYAEVTKKGDVELIAISAGGSLATRLLSEHPEIISASIVSAKISGSSGIGSNYQNRAPALLDAVRASEKALENVKSFENKVTVYRPFYDTVIPLKDMLVGNAKRRRVPGVTHAMGIGVALIFYLPEK